MHTNMQRVSQPQGFSSPARCRRTHPKAVPANGAPRLVAVRRRLVRAGLLDANVVGLLCRQHGQVGAELAEVQLCHLLVELLRQQVHLVLVLGLGLVLARVVVRLAQLKLSRRPSASTITPWPSGKMYLSHCGLMLRRLVAFSSCSIWISLSKWPMLPTMQFSFIFDMCSSVMMSLLPVVVMITSISPTPC